jgi:serine/threonine-protein kinase
MMSHVSIAPERAVCRTCGRSFGAGERFCPFDRSELQHEDDARRDPLVGTVVAGSYTLQRKLGSGGMGVVYLARQNRMERDVALKLLWTKLGEDKSSRERFRTEAVALSNLKNPHTVTAFDFGTTDDGLMYLVMQLVEGQSLRAHLHRGPLPVRSALSIAAQVAESLGEAHERRPHIIHRDIKPDNVIVRPTPDGEEFATVLDFGLAKLADHNRLTATGTVVGTPAYMAPEQALNKELDARCDLYALGVLIHEMVSGKTPFAAPSAAALLYSQVWDAPPALSASCPGVPLPPGLEQLVRELLSKNPAQRPVSANHVRSRLMEMLRGLPEDAPRLFSPQPVLAVVPPGPTSSDQFAAVSTPQVQLPADTDVTTYSTPEIHLAARPRGARVMAAKGWLFPVLLILLALTVFGVIRFAVGGDGAQDAPPPLVVHATSAASSAAQAANPVRPPPGPAPQAQSRETPAAPGESPPQMRQGSSPPHMSATPPETTPAHPEVTVARPAIDHPQAPRAALAPERAKPTAPRVAAAPARTAPHQKLDATHAKRAPAVSPAPASPVAPAGQGEWASTCQAAQSLDSPSSPAECSVRLQQWSACLVACARAGTTMPRDAEQRFRTRKETLQIMCELDRVSDRGDCKRAQALLDQAHAKGLVEAEREAAEIVKACR